MPLKKQSPKQKPQKMDDEDTPVGKPPEFPVDSKSHAATIETAYAEPGEVVSGEQSYAAQRVTAKVAKLLSKPNGRVPFADQMRVAHLALLAIAAGPKSVSRDIAVTALKVIG